MLEETEKTDEQKSETVNEKPTPADVKNSFGGTPKMSMPVTNPSTTADSAETGSEPKPAAGPKPGSSKPKQ